MEIMASSKNYGKKKVRITSGIFWTLMGKNLIMEKSDAGAACLSWTFFFFSHNSVGSHSYESSWGWSVAMCPSLEKYLWCSLKCPRWYHQSWGSVRFGTSQNPIGISFLLRPIPMTCDMWQLFHRRLTVDTASCSGQAAEVARRLNAFQKGAPTVATCSHLCLENFSWDLMMRRYETPMGYVIKMYCTILATPK